MESPVHPLPRIKIDNDTSIELGWQLLLPNDRQPNANLPIRRRKRPNPPIRQSRPVHLKSAQNKPRSPLKTDPRAARVHFEVVKAAEAC